MKKTFLNQLIIAALALATLAGCGRPISKTAKGAGIGTAGGAAVGAIVGKVAGNAALGAGIGAAVGGATGAIIGHKMDQQAKQIEEQVEDAKVERSEEGIVVTFDSNVLFGFDKSDLTPSAKSTIDKLYNIMENYPGEDVLIIGHTDNVGAASYNQGLSERRANSAADYLIEKGIERARVTTRGMGDTDPIVENDTKEHQAMNRRVEFVLTAGEEMIEQARMEAEQQENQ